VTANETYDAWDAATSERGRERVQVFPPRPGGVELPYWC
jgi:hypothetical protein